MQEGGEGALLEDEDGALGGLRVARPHRLRPDLRQAAVEKSGVMVLPLSKSAQACSSATLAMKPRASSFGSEADLSRSRITPQRVCSSGSHGYVAPRTSSRYTTESLCVAGWKECERRQDGDPVRRVERQDAKLDVRSFGEHEQMCQWAPYDLPAALHAPERCLAEHDVERAQVTPALRDSLSLETGLHLLLHRSWISGRFPCLDGRAHVLFGLQKAVTVFDLAGLRLLAAQHVCGPPLDLLSRARGTAPEHGLA